MTARLPGCARRLNALSRTLKPIRRPNLTRSAISLTKSYRQRWSSGLANRLSGCPSGLKKVLTNVKTRGTWGEVQLGALLEQMLAPDQYARNVAVVPKSSARVDF